MSLFYQVENFPFTVERENGDITPILITEWQLIKNTYTKIENIFNDNARIKS